MTDNAVRAVAMFTAVAIGFLAGFVLGVIV